MIINFMVSGILIASFIWILQNRLLPNPIRVILAVICLMGFTFSMYLAAGPVLLSQKNWYNASPFIEIILFLLMIFGMAARYFTNAIEVRRNKIKKRKSSDHLAYEKPSLEFDLWEFSYPLFFSVVTFGALLSQLDEKIISITSAVLSFQTGFFWQTILKQKIDRISNT